MFNEITDEFCEYVRKEYKGKYIIACDGMTNPPETLFIINGTHGTKERINYNTGTHGLCISGAYGAIINEITADMEVMNSKLDEIKNSKK
tara:strand:- start:519 stop:788 length:270 start_codon:yes stop_codon:yes gene_type:complete